VIELRDVHTYYADSYILQGISLEVKEASMAALLGRNGMGKTTTIRTIIGFTPAREGIIRFKEKEIQSLKPHKIARMGIGLVPQGRQIFPSLSVYENLTMAARDMERSDAWNMDRIYNLFPILKTRARIKGTLLSGGEQQMLTIGRALMTNPALLLMDEPSEGLAPIIVEEIGHIIGRLKESGILALDLADYVYIISKGVIEYKSKPDDLIKSEEIVTKYLGVAGNEGNEPASLRS
jgi:branched-chain amino acid transport system ATP-binding protein